MKALLAVLFFAVPALADTGATIAVDSGDTATADAGDSADSADSADSGFDGAVDTADSAALALDTGDTGDAAIEPADSGLDTGGNGAADSGLVYDTEAWVDGYGASELSGEEGGCQGMSGVSASLVVLLGFGIGRRRRGGEIG